MQDRPSWVRSVYKEERVLPASIVVHYDDEAPGWAVANRIWVSRALAEAGPGIAASTVNSMLREADAIVPHLLRSTVGAYVIRPRPNIPVQMDLELTMVPDELGELARRLEEVRLVFAARTLDWFQARHTEFSELYQRMELTAVRTTLWIGREILRLEMDPATREVIASEGGRRYYPGFYVG